MNNDCVTVRVAWAEHASHVLLVFYVQVPSACGFFVGKLHGRCVMHV